MALDKLNPKLINTTGASDGDALVFRSANSQIEFGSVSADTSGLSAGISGANTNIDTVQSNADAFATYSNSTFGTATNLNTVQSNVDTFASYSNLTFASTTYVDTEISNLVNSAPSTLDTLNEIAAALGNDANLSVTLTNQINSISSNTSIVETNLDTYGSYANSTFALDTSLNIVQANLDSFASYSNTTFALDSDLNTVQANLTSLLTSNTTAITVVNANLVPSGNIEYALGSPNHLWSDLWLSGASLHLGNVHIFETADGSGFHMTSPHSEHTLTLDIASGNSAERFGNVEHAITSANTNINTVQSNLTTTDSTVTALSSEVDSLGSYANTTFATDNNLNTVSANVDGVSFGLSGANTNISIISGNLDAYATYANATFSGGGGGSGDAALVQANLDSFASYANTTFSGSGGGNTVTATSTSTGDGSTVNYTLPSTVSNAHNVLVTVDGLLQRPVSDYTVNATTLTFASAPPLGTEVDIRQLSESGVVSIQAYASNAQILTSNVHSITVKNANLLPTLGSTYDLGSETYNWNNIHASNIISPSAGYYWVEATSNTTMGAGKAYFVDCSSQTITMTLPGSPNMGNSVRIIDATGSSETNNITIARNSSNIMGQADDITVNQNRAAFMLVYYNTAQGWLLSEV